MAIYSTRELIEVAQQRTILTEDQQTSIDAVKGALAGSRKYLHNQIADAEKKLRESWEQLEALGIASTYAQLTNNHMPLAVVLGMVKKESVPEELLSGIQSLGG